VDIDTLLAPVRPDAPCGDNLEYDADFLRMMQLASGKAEQQFGDTLIAAQEPDWRQVEHIALGLLAKSKDLRIMLLLAQAWTDQRALAGYADGLSLIDAALKRYWDPLLPTLWSGGEQDPFMRINVLRELGDSFVLATQVRHSPFIRTGAGNLTLLETMHCLEDRGSAAEKYSGGSARLLADIRQGDSPQARYLPRIINAIDGIVGQLRRHLGENALPEMSLTLGLLQALASASSPAAISPLTAGNVMTQADPRPEDVMPKTGSHDGLILTRADAGRALENARQYFERCEPGHPAPLLIARIQQLMEQDFMAIIAELAPEAISPLKLIFGVKNNN
jgi:type VI secretion system protein ImpA